MSNSLITRTGPQPLTPPIIEEKKEELIIDKSKRISSDIRPTSAKKKKNKEEEEIPIIIEQPKEIIPKWFTADQIRLITDYVTSG
jgi:hypothetical protein